MHNSNTRYAPTVHSYIHTYIHTWHTYIHDIHSCMYVCMYVCMLYIPSYIQHTRYIHKYIHTYIHECINRTSLTIFDYCVIVLVDCWLVDFVDFITRGIFLFYATCTVVTLLLFFCCGCWKPLCGPDEILINISTRSSRVQRQYIFVISTNENGRTFDAVR